MFKTLYFPASKSSDAEPERVTLSFPEDGPDPETNRALKQIADMSSQQIRTALGDPSVSQLRAAAEREKRSLSNYCLTTLTTNLSSDADTTAQIALDIPNVSRNGGRRPGLGRTFRDSKKEPYHRWFPYVEGFSVDYVRPVLDSMDSDSVVYDPFGGAGTIPFEASVRGLHSAYAEVNPFMRFVADTKTTAARQAAEDISASMAIAEDFLASLHDHRFSVVRGELTTEDYDAAFGDRDYFGRAHLRDLLATRELIDAVVTDASHPMSSILRLALAANVVHSSNMTRRADLRRRRADEYKTRVVDVRAFVRTSVQAMMEDLLRHPRPEAPVSCVAEDARQLMCNEAFDIAITSPPYLNGTNYFRNTKLELWFLGFITSESDLADFRRRGITAGINNVQSGSTNGHFFPFVEEIASELDVEAKDKRIPRMVRGYFSDMYDVLQSVCTSLKPNGRFLLDIGDSKFYGVHVRTDELLIRVAEEAGLRLQERTLLATRRSYDKTELVQVELEFQKVRP